MRIITISCSKQPFHTSFCSFISHLFSTQYKQQANINCINTARTPMIAVGDSNSYLPTITERAGKLSSPLPTMLGFLCQWVCVLVCNVSLFAHNHNELIKVLQRLPNCRISRTFYACGFSVLQFGLLLRIKDVLLLD